MSIIPFVKRAWRVCGTAIGFSMFGLGGLLLAHVIYFGIMLFVHDADKRTKTFRRAITLSFKCFRNTMVFLRVFDVKFSNLERLKNAKRCIFIANHPSLIDYVLLCSELSNCCCLVKSSLLKNPFFGKVISGAKYIPNDSDQDMLSICEEHLQNNENILIFPEGTRTQDISKVKLKRGAANIALRCSSNVMVVKIELSERFLAKNQKWYDVPTKMPVYQFKCVNEIPSEDILLQDEEHMSKAVRALNRRFYDELFIKNFDAS